MIIAGLLCYQNATRAKRRGMNPLVWGVLTFVAFIIGNVLAMLLEFMIFYKGEITDQEAVKKFFSEDLMAQFVVLLGGFGGYLAIRAMINSRQPPPTDGPAE
jgi:hypothetical protein